MLKSLFAIYVSMVALMLCPFMCGAQNFATSSGKAGLSALEKSEQAMETKIRAIIAQKGDVNQREKNIPLLVWAVENKYVNCVKLLLENKADPEIPHQSRAINKNFYSQCSYDQTIAFLGKTTDKKL